MMPISSEGSHLLNNRISFAALSFSTAEMGTVCGLMLFDELNDNCNARYGVSHGNIGENLGIGKHGSANKHAASM